MAMNMIKLKSLIYLNEHFDSADEISIDDVEKLLSSNMVDRDSLSVLRTIVDFYHSEDKNKQQDIIDYFYILNNAYNRIINIANSLKVPYFELNTIKKYLLSQNEFHFKVEEFFPAPLYISSSPQDESTVGILVDFNGKVLEIHEGSDEATPETTNLANKLVNPSGKKERIYASHNRDLVFKIDVNGYLPANLFVSPSKEHAKSHLDLEGTREMFTGIIDSNDVSHESDLDWKTIGVTKIEKFRFI